MPIVSTNQMAILSITATKVLDCYGEEEPVEINLADVKYILIVLSMKPTREGYKKPSNFEATSL